MSTITAIMKFADPNKLASRSDPVGVKARQITFGVWDGPVDGTIFGIPVVFAAIASRANWLAKRLIRAGCKCYHGGYSTASVALLTNIDFVDVLDELAGEDGTRCEWSRDPTVVSLKKSMTGVMFEKIYDTGFDMKTIGINGETMYDINDNESHSHALAELIEDQKENAEIERAMAVARDAEENNKRDEMARSIVRIKKKELELDALISISRYRVPDIKKWEMVQKQKKQKQKQKVRINLQDQEKMLFKKDALDKYFKPVHRLDRHFGSSQ